MTWFYNYQIDNKNFQNLRGKVGVLLGYCDKSRSYLIWNPETKRVVRSAEVVFNEQILPFHQFDMNNPAQWRITWGQNVGEEPHTLGSNPIGQPIEFERVINNESGVNNDAGEIGDSQTEQTNKQTNEQTNEQTNKQTNEQTNMMPCHVLIPHLKPPQTNKQTNEQTNKQTN